MSTMKRVAEQAGVSIATVSRVVNKSGFVAPPLQKLVMEAMEALKYQPSAVARGLRTRETRSIGVLVPQLSQPFFGLLAYAIERTLFRHGYRAFLCSAEEDAAEESAYLDMLLSQRVDGLILVPTGQSKANVRRVLQAKVCVVLVDRDLPMLKIDRILSDNFTGAYQLARHLIALGHRRIGIISAPQHSGSIARRVAGINHAMLEAGIQPDRSLFVEGALEQFQLGFMVAQQFLQSPRPPTAVMALTDMIAVGALHAAWKAGLSLPHDLSVTGFDDVPLARYTMPELTTASQPVYEMGEKASLRLLRRLQKPDLKVRRTLLPISLAIRGSTAPARIP
jgi:LacI family transcriptional regulator